MKLTGSQIIAEILLEEGVDTVFGYPGGAALNVYDALYEYRDQIRHILSAHEQGAAHAADGYARATGRTGVVMATSGPGATNLVTGLATAFMDSVPVVAITTNVPQPLIGRDAFQEVFITGVTMPVTKHNFFVNSIEELPGALHDAFRIAGTGRKGPVHIDVTKDVTAATLDYKPGKHVKESVPLPPVGEKQLKKIADVINGSKRPILYLGGGAAASDAAKEIAELMEIADIPAAYTLMGAGLVGHDDPRNLGMLGMHGSIAANSAADKSDMMLALGTRFDDRVALNPGKFGKKATKIHVDIDRSEINKNVTVDIGVHADVKEFLKQLLPLIAEKKHEEWNAELAKKKNDLADPKTEDEPLHPAEIVRAVCANTDKDTIYVTDVGQHQMWVAQYLDHHNTRRLLTSGGLGTMGFGYGAAIGAQIGCPDKRIIHFTGDGSFHMNLNEACTAVSQELPIITVIMNNRVLGMVYQWQTNFYGSRYSATEPERATDFVKVAEGFGATGYRAETPEEFEKVFRKALKAKGPVWIDCPIAREERVLPMIPNGGTSEDMIIG